MTSMLLSQFTKILIQHIGVESIIKIIIFLEFMHKFGMTNFIHFDLAYHRRKSEIEICTHGYLKVSVNSAKEGILCEICWI